MAGRPAILSIRIVANSAQAAKQIKQFNRELEDLTRSADKAAKIAAVTGALVDLGAALVPVAAAATSAALGLGAFGIAAAGQVSSLTTAAAAAKKLTDAQTEAAAKKATADRLAASGSALAGKAANQYQSALLKVQTAQDQYNETVKEMPAATAAAALAFGQLQSAYKQWSDSLASTTMPLFTDALDGLKAALPALTPLVKAAAAALAPFVAQFKDAAQSGAIAKFLDSFSGAARTNIANLTATVVNLTVAVFQLIKPFTVEGEKVTKALADWSKGIRDLTGNQEAMGQFAAFADKAVTTLGNLVAAALKVIANLGPLAGLTLTLANAFAVLVLNTPNAVLAILGPLLLSISVALRLIVPLQLLYNGAILAYNVAMLIATSETVRYRLAVVAWRAVSIAATVAVWALTAAQTALDAALAASGISEVVILIVALIAALVLLITKNKKVRDALLAAWRAIWSAVKTAYTAVQTAIMWIGRVTVSGGMRLLKAAWSGLKTATDAVVSVVRSLIGWLGKVAVPKALSSLKAAWDGIKDAVNSVIGVLKTAWSWVKKFSGGILGKIVSAASKLSATAPAPVTPSTQRAGLGASAFTAAAPFTARLIAPVQVTVLLDGAPLRAMVKKTVSGAMQYDGSRLASGGWA
jgi:hypothetical protein